MKDRISKALDDLGYMKRGRISGLQRITGFSVGQVSDMMSGNKPVSDKFARIVCSEFGISLNWVNTGEGEMFENKQPWEAPWGGKKPKPNKDKDSEFVLVPRYNVAGSAGGGALVDQEEVLEYLSFRKDWIKNSLRISENYLAVISVKGDSMEPRLHDGDVVLLDMETKSIQDNAIYALQFNGGLSIKRVQQFMSGQIEIISDNKTYKPELLSPDQAADLNVVGRVVWAGGKV